MTLSVAPYPLGRNNDTFHDPASLAFPAPALPDYADVVHPIAATALDQGDLGSCTGNAQAQLLNTDMFQAILKKLLTEDDAKELYSWATRHDRYPGFYPPTDTGSGGLYAAKAAKTLKYISSYSHAFGVDHLAGGLQLAPAIVGTVWSEGMFTPDSRGFLNPTGAVAGGHEYLIYGFSVSDDAFLMRNSWGASWGDQGNAKIRRTVMGHLLAQHGDVTFSHI